MNQEWKTPARHVALALCLGGSLLLFGCGSTQTTTPPVTKASPPVATTGPARTGPTGPAVGAPSPGPAGTLAPAAVPTGSAGQKMHGTVKMYDPERTSVEITMGGQSSNYMVKSPAVLEKVSPGDEVDVVMEDTPKGRVVTTVAVTKSGGGSPIPKREGPGTPGTSPPSGAPARTGGPASPAPAVSGSPSAK